jgi:hypothetical protein
MPKKRKGPARKTAAPRRNPAKRKSAPRHVAPEPKVRAVHGKAVNKGGRPTLRTPQIEEEILDRLAAGEPLCKICDDEHMPHEETVRVWARSDEGFFGAYVRARRLASHKLFDDCLSIADDTTEDWVHTKYGPMFVKEAAQRSRIKIDTRMRMAARLNPADYAEKIDLTSGNKPLAHLSDVELDRRIEGKLAIALGTAALAAADKAGG